jgi:deoxyribose-phosphate aldolase
VSGAAAAPADRPAAARRALALLDLTTLEPGDTDDTVRALCGRAVTPAGPVAAVCIWPRSVRAAKAALAGSPVRVATVVNFPAGGTDAGAAAAETRAAVADGADEIDMVLPYTAFAAGDRAAAEAVLRAVREACLGRTLKVILETGLLPDAATVRAAADLAVAGGADFLKTSTGKAKPAATPEAARILCEAAAAAGGRVGVKPAGGIRDLDAAVAYLAIADEVCGAGWARPATFRFGASGLLDALLGELGYGAGAGKPAGY